MDRGERCEEKEAVKVVVVVVVVCKIGPHWFCERDVRP